MLDDALFPPAEAPPVNGHEALAGAALPPALFALPERVERLECPDIYAGQWVEVVTNLPPARVRGLTMEAFLVAVVRAWSFRTADGAPAPVTPEALSALPPDLLQWLLQEYIERRDRPLAQRAPSSPPPTT